MTNPVRQGDVLLIPIAREPKGLKPEKSKGERIILARGEQTGHHHSVAVADAEILTTDTVGEVERFLRVHRETALTHQEHAAITLKPGLYTVRQQREYVPKALPRRVAD